MRFASKQQQIKKTRVTTTCLFVWVYAVGTVRNDERTKKEYQTNGKKRRNMKHAMLCKTDYRHVCVCAAYERSRKKIKKEKKRDKEREDAHNMNGA